MGTWVENSVVDKTGDMLDQDRQVVMINSDVFKAAIVCVVKNEKFNAQSGCDRGQ